MSANRKPDHRARPDDVIRVADRFYVLATSSLAEDRTHVLKHGETFGVFDRYGDIQPLGLGEQGLYHEGTRFLSRFALFLDGMRPLLLSSGVDAENTLLRVDLMNPDLLNGDHTSIPRGEIHIHRERLLWTGAGEERLRIHNFGSHTAHVALSLRFEADFADIFEVRGMIRESRGRRLPPRVQDDAVGLGYDGLDGVRRTAWIRCRPRPTSADEGSLRLELVLEPRSMAAFELQVDCELGNRKGRPAGSFNKALERTRARGESLRSRDCRVTTSNHQFNDWFERSRADLRLMMSETSLGWYPHAGVPWFSTPFGRDGLITALQTIWMEPQTTRDVLACLAATQADADQPEIDAEPGKIVHEIRAGEMAAVGQVPYARYYGSVDSTPLFVYVAGEYLRGTDDVPFVESIWPNIERALGWMRNFGDLDGDGYLEYDCRSANGLINQGWKDSRDSVSHADGTLAESPIALCEVQGYAYAAWRAAAEMADRLERGDLARDCDRRADELKASFRRDFWDDDLGVYALALDGKKRRCRSVTSNAGQCLFTRIADPEHAERVAHAMLSPALFNGWGVRTLAAGHPRYNPMSYHNGSVWPHDTALIALGMSRYGLIEHSERLMQALLDLALHVELRRLPELVCGFERVPGERPTSYPLACSPQAWAAGVVFMTLRACLGLEVRADRSEVRFRHAALPEFLERVQVRELQVGGKSIDVEVQRHATGSAVRVMRRSPGVELVL